MNLENLDPQTTSQPEVVEAVINEIKAMGDKNKEIHEKLMGSYEDLKLLIDQNEKKIDPLLTERINKFSEDIVTKQQALDKNLTDRMDAVEVAMKRPWMSQTNDQESMEFKNAREFQISCAAAKTGGDGADWRRFENPEIVNVQGFNEYKKAFTAYIRSIDNQQLLPEQFKTLLVGSDPQGGYLCPPEMSNRITKKLFETDPIRQLADVITISRSSYEELVDWGDAGAEWESEATGAYSDETTPTINKLAIVPAFIRTKPKATQQFLEDSIINAENWLADKVANRFLRKEGEGFVTGNGVDKARGFTTYSTGTSYGQVEQIAMLHASALTADGFKEVKFGLIEYYMNRGTWLMNRSTVKEATKLKDGTGRYLWQPGFAANEPATIEGLPYRMSPSMPTIAANALAVALADWKEAYLIVDRIGITVLRNPYKDPPFIEFYTRKRVSGACKNFQAIKIGKISAT